MYTEHRDNPILGIHYVAKMSYCTKITVMTGPTDGLTDSTLFEAVKNVQTYHWENLKKNLHNMIITLERNKIFLEPK